MSQFASDRATADLTTLEEGCLRGLASLGPTSVADLEEFCAGFCRSRFTDRDMGHALFALDALGWAIPTDGIPRPGSTWRITEQGRIALEVKR